MGAIVGIAGVVITKILPPNQNGDKEKISGLALTVFGMIMMIYSLVIFRLRAAKIRNRIRGRLDDPIGKHLQAYCDN